MSGRLVALALDPHSPDFGARFQSAISSIWDKGDAFAPIDPRLPRSEIDRVMAALAPSAVMEADGEVRSLPEGRPVADGDALVIATSGTSGQPKGVVHTHESIQASARATSTMLGVDPGSDRWLACLPLAHIGGLSVVLRSLVTDTPVEIHPGFDPDAVVGALDRGATLVSLVTRALVQVPVERFRTVLVGGAAAPDTLADNVVATYGMTETGSGVVYRSSRGQHVLDGVEIRIDDTGQIWIRGPMLLRCYRDGSSPVDEAGWFPTGDLGAWSPDGDLVVEGRAGDAIVTGGEKVWPAPIEAWLAERDDVAEVALVGVPDPEWGQRMVAVVVVGTEPPSLDALKAHVRDRFAPWAAPRELVVSSTPLPRTSLGKLRRAAVVASLPSG